MQIQLKQTEIESALKGYIAQQGINLTNKVITYSFTAGRKDSGISVELEIEEVPSAAFQGELKRSTDFVAPSASLTSQAPSPFLGAVIALQADCTVPECALATPTSSLFA